MNPDEPQAGAPRPATDSALDDLVFECLEHIESDGAQALADFCRAHPAEAAELLQRITALVAMGLVDVKLDNEARPSA